MFIANVSHKGRFGVGVSDDGVSFRCELSDSPALDEAVLAAAEKRKSGTGAVDLKAGELRFLPPLSMPPKIVCVGLNYAEHSKETGNQLSSYPAVFARFATSLIGHEQPMIRPAISEQLDFEGELVAIIGKGGRNIKKSAALDHILGYSLFNDGSVRDYQRKSSQWTVGKNFDGTGAFGPWIVTPDQLPPGCAGLNLQTRLNGQVVQQASTNDLVFDVATLISTLSEAFTLSRGDVIVTGTPSGVGAARKPPLWMKPGDVCEVEVDRVGILRNKIVDEAVKPNA
jgi:acylpyruvate hydrolase